MLSVSPLVPLLTEAYLTPTPAPAYTPLDREELERGGVRTPAAAGCCVSWGEAGPPSAGRMYWTCASGLGPEGGVREAEAGRSWG